MRPTISEQLTGLRRILDEVVAPEVDVPYPAETLRGVIANLEMLARAYTNVGPFLAWDNAATKALLAAARGVVDAGLASHIDDALFLPDVDALDLDALDARNTLLRGLLAAAIAPLAGGGGATATVYASVCVHLRERMARYPFTMTTSLLPPK
jgi:hypothetical protein